MADKQISQLVAATTVNDEDLLVMQQGGIAKKLSGRTLGDYVYSAAAEKIAEVDQAVSDAQDALDTIEEQKNAIAQTVASMAQLGTDTTLTTPGMAADAKATGDKIEETISSYFDGGDDSVIEDVPVASFDDGADNKPVKNLTIDINPVQDLHGYDNPWPAGGGKNLFNPNNLANGYLNGSGGFVERASAILTDYISVTPEAVYVLSSGTDTNFYSLNIAEYDSTKTWIRNNIVNSRTSFSKTLDSTASFVRLMYNLDNSTALDASTFVNTYKPQFELGSSATAWTPYENVCPITGWTGVDVTGAGKNLLSIDNGQIGKFFNSQYELADNSRGFSSAKIKVKPNTYYTVSVRAEELPVQQVIGKFDKNGTPISRLSFQADSPFLTTATEDYWIVSFLCPSGVTMTKELALSYKIQVEESSGEYPYHPTEYEVGNGATYSVSFPALGKNLWSNYTGYKAITQDTSNYIESFENMKAGVENGQMIFYGMAVGGTDVVYNQNNQVAAVIKVTPGSTYTTNGYTKSKARYLDKNGNDLGIGSENVSNNQLTFTAPSGACYALIYVHNYAQTLTANPWTIEELLSGFQIELGSTATTYEPYNNTVYGGTLTINEDGSGELVATMAKIDATQMAYQRESAVYADKENDIYGLVFNINSIFKNTQSPENAIAYSNMLKSVKNASNNGVSFLISTNLYMSIYSPTNLIADVNYPQQTKASVEAYLQSIGLYVVGELATPITYTLTAQQVRTLLGTNNIWANTGNIKSLTYVSSNGSGVVKELIEEEVGIARSEIEQMIAGVEEDMTATTNYTTDSLVVADNKLYKLTADVATGQTLTPGSNCTQTTIAAVLDELRAGLGASDAGGVTYSDSETYETGSVGEKLQALASSVTTIETDVDALEEDLNTLEDTVNGSFSDSTITDAAIATFSDGVAGTNLKKLTVGMSPVQDLHGHDAPWPAGGGKNKFGTNALSGYPNASGGISTTSTSQEYYVDYLPVVGDATYTIGYNKYASEETMWLAVAWYDSDKEFISRSTVSNFAFRTFTAPSNAAYAIPSCSTFGHGLDGCCFYQGDEGTFIPYENVCPITGWTGVTETRTGKNILDLDRLTDGATIIIQSNRGTASYNAETKELTAVTSYTGTGTVVVDVAMPEGKQLTFSNKDDGYVTLSFYCENFVPNASDQVRATMYLTDGTYYFGNVVLQDNRYVYSTQASRLAGKTANKILFYVSYGGSAISSGDEFKIWNLQLEYSDANNVATDYTPSQSITVPIAFPALGKNLFNGVVTNQRVTENGDGTVSIASTGSWRLTDFIPVEPGEVYAVYNEDGSYNNGGVFTTWDANKQFVGWYSSYRVNPAATIPEGVAYIRVQVTSTMYANSNGHISVCKVTGISASTLIPYEPYNNTVYSGTLTINEDRSGELTVNKQKLTATSYTVAGVRTDGYYCRLNVNGSYLASSNNALFKANLAKIGKYSTTTTPILEARVNSAGNSGEASTWMHLYIPNTVVDYDPEGSSTLAQCITRDLPPANWEIIVPLVESITYHLSEQQVISVLNGENNVWVDAGNIAELTYYTQAQPGIRDYIDAAYSDIEHMLSGVESEMTATRNYAEGALFVAEHKLYNATTSIASGDELVPGTNCNVTTVEAQLNAVRSSIAALDAAKVDKSAFLAAITGTYDIYPTDTLTDQVVAHFTDGANDVPVKKLVAQINPVQSGTGDPSPENVRPISGWTGCNVTGTGKNLFGGLDLGNKIHDTVPDSTIDTTAKTVTFASGKHDSGNWFTEFKENTRYTFILSLSSTQDDSTATNIRVKYTDGTLVNMTKSGTSKQTIVYNSKSGKSLEFFGYSSQIGATTLYYDESGIFEGVLTAEDFNTYQGTTIPCTFPEEAGTVYQGTLTINEDGSGVLLNKSTKMTVSASSISAQTSYSYQNIDYAIFAKPANAKLRDIMNSVDTYCICDRAPINRSKDNFDNASIIGSLAVGAQGAWFWFGFEKGTSLDDMKAALDGMEIVYELGDSYTTAYTLTAQQVKTLLGENNICADTGNVDVTYRADSGLYIAKKIAEAIA